MFWAMFGMSVAGAFLAAAGASGTPDPNFRSLWKRKWFPLYVSGI